MVRSASAAASWPSAKSGLAKSGSGGSRHLLGRQHHRFQRAFVDQPVDHAGRDAGLARGVALGAREPVAEQRQHARARHGHALRRRTGKPHADALAAGAEMLAHAQRHAQHHAARGERVAGDPVDEAAQLRLERRHVELPVDVLQPVVQARIGVGVLGPDHAQGLARAERHRHQVAGRKFEPGRHPVGIGLIERDRHQDIDDTHAHKVKVWPIPRRLRKGEGSAPTVVPAKERREAAGTQ